MHAYVHTVHTHKSTGPNTSAYVHIAHTRAHTHTEILTRTHTYGHSQTHLPTPAYAHTRAHTDTGARTCGVLGLFQKGDVTVVAENSVFYHFYHFEPKRIEPNKRGVGIRRNVNRGRKPDYPSFSSVKNDNATIFWG